MLERFNPNRDPESYTPAADGFTAAEKCSPHLRLAGCQNVCMLADEHSYCVKRLARRILRDSGK